MSIPYRPHIHNVVEHPSSSYYLAVKDKTGQYVYVETPKLVYQYVRQLETYIKYPHQSKLKTRYPERFLQGRLP